jgi:hypothetical protein
MCAGSKGTLCSILQLPVTFNRRGGGQKLGVLHIHALSGYSHVVTQAPISPAGLPHNGVAAKHFTGATTIAYVGNK